MSRRSVENQLSKLEEKGLICIKSRRRDQGGKTSNSYILTMQNCDAQNLRMGSAKSAHGYTQNLRMNNLGNNNLGNELERDDFQEGFQGVFHKPKPRSKKSQAERCIEIASKARRSGVDELF